jgi:miniconductance mechanosensitive channel
MKHIIELIVQLLTSWGLPANVATNLSITILFIGLTILIYIIDVVLKKIIRATFTKIANKSKTDFDDIMLANRVPSSIAQIVPFILTYKLIPNLFYDFEKLKDFSEKTILVVGIGLTIWGLRNILNSLKIYLKTLNFLKDKPVDSYIQVFMIFVWLTGVFATVAIVSGISFLEFIAG